MFLTEHLANREVGRYSIKNDLDETMRKMFYTIYYFPNKYEKDSFGRIAYDTCLERY
jgi:hypothetical protein